jgi:hypothetical protein
MAGPAIAAIDGWPCARTKWWAEVAAGLVRALDFASVAPAPAPPPAPAALVGAAGASS